MNDDDRAYVDRQYDRAEELMNSIACNKGNVPESVHSLLDMYEDINKKINENRNFASCLQNLDVFNARGKNKPLNDASEELAQALIPLRSEMAIALHYAKRHHSDEINGMLDGFNISHLDPL